MPAQPTALSRSDYIARLVAQAPPFSPRQRDQLAVILSPSSSAAR